MVVGKSTAHTGMPRGLDRPGTGDGDPSRVGVGVNRSSVNSAKDSLRCCNHCCLRSTANRSCGRLHLQVRNSLLPKHFVKHLP